MEKSDNSSEIIYYLRLNSDVFHPVRFMYLSGQVHLLPYDSRGYCRTHCLVTSFGGGEGGVSEAVGVNPGEKSLGRDLR